jgi:hypothetical protein
MVTSGRTFPLGLFVLVLLHPWRKSRLKGVVEKVPQLCCLLAHLGELSIVPMGAKKEGVFRITTKDVNLS